MNTVLRFREFMSGKHWSSAAWFAPSDATIVSADVARRRYKGMKIASSRPAFRRVWTICAGAAFTNPRRACARQITWILDGLEVTLAGALSGAFERKFDAAFHQFFDVGFSNSA